MYVNAPCFAHIQRLGLGRHDNYSEKNMLICLWGEVICLLLLCYSIKRRCEMLMCAFDKEKPNLEIPAVEIMAYTPDVFPGRREGIV